MFYEEKSLVGLIPNDIRGRECFFKCHVTFFGVKMTFFIVFEDILGLQDVKNNFPRHTGGGGGGSRLYQQKMTHEKWA
jgi:hypothetical protein